ncbi:MAG: hypothetical protein AAFW60_05185, partial [Pseudomonadota bacterium]
MLRRSAAPIALCVFILAGCDSGSEDAMLPESVVPGPTEPTPADPPSTETEYTLTITSPPESGTKTSTNSASSKPRSLATLPENRDWTLIARSPDGRGNFLTLRLTDAGNGDAEAFTYDNDSGELTLRTPLDYERPIDADADNTFELLMELTGLPGKPTIPFALDVTDMSEIFEDFPVVWLNGETEFGGLGRAITPLGDIDSDGRPDLAVAAPGRHARDAYTSLPPSDYHPAGEVYFVSGDVLSETTFFNLNAAPETGLAHIIGTPDDLNLGYNMTLIGDLDEDEIEDFIVSSDASTIEIISGATLIEAMTQGLDTEVSEIGSGQIRLDGDTRAHDLNPRTFAPIGDLDDDGLTDLAFCATELRFGSNVDAQIFIVSGTVLQDALSAGGTQQIADLFAPGKVGYSVYSGNHSTCGPLTALGDIDGDELVDLAIPMPGPLADDSGVLIYSGAQMLGVLQAGGRQQVTPFQKFQGVDDHFIQFTDTSARATEQHHMVTALGDVTGDGIDDFGFGWGRYHTASDSAYVVKGAQGLLTPGTERVNIRSLMQRGGAIQLAASPEGLSANAYRVEPVHVLRAPEDGLHDTLIFVGAGESSSSQFENFSLSADDLPSGGTAIAPLPISGLGG